MKTVCKLVLLSAALATASCQEARPVEDAEASAPVIAPGQAPVAAPLYYHIFVRSFTDSDGDQNGDLQGIIDSLDYLQSLGVTGILLTPIYPSEFYHNYFADDFYGVDPEFGDMDTYLALVNALHQRDMTLIMDQEIQYVSGQHDWYVSALNNPNSPVDGLALFADEANTEPVGTLFGRTEFDVWPNQQQTIVTVDMLNPAVKAYFEEYLLFWMDPNGDGDFSDGVDGYRIDHMMDDLDNAGVLTGLFDAFWIPIFDELRAANPDIVIVAEQADWGYGESFLNDGETDMVFGFPIWDAVAKLDAEAFATAVQTTNEIITAGHDQFVFIENHDTPRFAGHGRNREDILKLGAAANLLTGWTPIIYYGQEIGMTGDKAESDAEADLLRGSIDDARDIPVRQAFRWHPNHEDGTLATWYRANPEAYPLDDSNQPGDGVSVSEQDGDPTSLLSTYRALSKLRGEHPALATGSTTVVGQDGEAVLLRRNHAGGEVWVAFNFSEAATELNLPSSPAELLYGEATIQRDGGSLTASLEPYGVAVWSLSDS